ncbi:RNA-binding protein 25 [Echria macrotheca]|uniref:RNA-binding protein 25 n=1 Tax=Echria macrotheca TaxID=438768 RepID=A0AAJ0B8G6_9PEZI|nr:RNA-binding protein 25 [Echria macrotheca]
MEVRQVGPSITTSLRDIADTFVVPPYGPPPTYAPFPGAPLAPGMAPPPGLGPPPGMSSAPGMAPPPGVQQQSMPAQANRPSGLPASFQPPANLPNINFNAPVIRLGATAPPSKPGGPLAGDRKDSHTPTSARPGLGMDRGFDYSRVQMRDTFSLVPPTREERLMTVFVHKIPDGVGGEDGIQRLLGTVGRIRRWDSGHSHMSEHKGALFGFAQYENPESLAAAVELLKDVEVPVKRQQPSETPADDASIDDIDKVKLKVEFDTSTIKYVESWKESNGDGPAFEAKLEDARNSLKRFVRDLFFPRINQDGDGDTHMGDGANGHGDSIEVINIPLAQEDELADIPPEMRETVAAEIAAFRDRSNQRDMERLRREEEFEEQERVRNGAPRISRLDSPPRGSSNTVPLGPRGVPNAPSGPRGRDRGIDFVNGGTVNGYSFREEDDTDASDEELHERELSRQKAEDEKLYLEAERKWVNRERQRTAALDRERERERAETEGFSRRREEQLAREKNWDDEREASRRNHIYYRDHATWFMKRTADRAEEAARDEMDRRAEEEERRKAEADLEQARGMADSFLERQAEEMERRPAAAPAAPQRFTISFGAAAQKAAQKSAQSRRTVAEVEGLLDDEEQEQTTKRQLVPIKFEPITDTKTMSEEDLQKAIKALAHEIPTDRDGLWAWEVKWDYLEDSVLREKLRPFVEKKVVEYLGVQEEFLVDMVDEHLRKHQKPGELVETLAEALDEDAEDLVKKLWRMVIFFTECEKRGLPA